MNSERVTRFLATRAGDPRDCPGDGLFYVRLPRHRHCHGWLYRPGRTAPAHQIQVMLHLMHSNRYLAELVAGEHYVWLGLSALAFRQPRQAALYRLFLPGTESTAIKHY